MPGNKTDNGVHEIGTDEIRQAYADDTPGQAVEDFIKEQEKAFHEQKQKNKKHFSQVFQNPLKGFPYNEEIEVKPINEVTDQEIKASKKLSKDVEKLKKDFYKIVKMGDETLRDPKYNDAIDHIILAQRKILSMVGELETQKILDQRKK